MSVDDRLREAFGATDRSWDEHVPETLSALTVRHRRESIVRRGTAAALVAAAAVAVVAVTVSQRADKDPSPIKNPTPAPSGTAGPGEATNPLNGTWVSEPLTKADVRRAARMAGDVGDAQAMLKGLPPLPFRVALYVDGDRSYVHAVFRVDGKPEENADEENVTVSGDRVVMQPIYADGENVHTYVLDDGTLRLRFVSTTEGAEDGVPGEAWQRLVYDTAAFTSRT